MDNTQVNPVLLTSTAMFTDKLSNSELLQFHMAVITENDCSAFEWYPKIKGLLRSDGSMTGSAIAALGELVQIRFAGSER